MEERIVAVMFTDLVGSTEVFGRLGTAEADRLRAGHFQDVSTTVAEHGGELVKTLGDGVMAVFNLATRALDAGAAAQARFAMPGAADALPGLRVGISVGQVSYGDGDFHGRAVNEAARLCQAARPGQILCSSVVHQVIGSGTGHIFGPVDRLALKGLSDAFAAEELAWAPPETAQARVVLADDSVIVRQGLARLLQDEGFRVVGQAGDADALLRLVDELVPDVVVTDIRMPPTMTLDGLEAALEIRQRHPKIGILVLSQHLEAEYALRLLGDHANGVGYLLKERVTAVDAFAVAVRRVTGGGTAVDPEVVQALMHHQAADDPVAALSDREAEVLSLMAEGLSNGGIAERLVVSQRTVESHVASIFTKLGMLPEGQEDRRVLAVVRYLQARR